MSGPKPEQVIAAQKNQIRKLNTELSEENAERRRMATLRWEAEERFRSLLGNLPFPVRLYELMGRDKLVLSGANQAADRILGIEHEFLMGKPAEETIFHRAGPELIDQLLNVVKTGSPLYLRVEYMQEDNREAGLDLHAFLLSPYHMAAVYYPSKGDTGDLVLPPPNPEKPETILAAGMGRARGAQPEQVRNAPDKPGKHRPSNKFTSLEDISYTDLFMVDELQDIQDAFAKATNLASIITHPDGRPITRPSNFCRLCQDIIRRTPKGRANCERSDAFIGRRNPSGPIMHACFSGGLWDGGASICVGQKHVASWLVGQVRDDSKSDESMLAYARQIGADEAEFMAALNEVPHTSSRQFSDVCSVLFIFANQMSELALQNVLQARSIVGRQEAEAELRRSRARLHHLSAKLIMAQEEERKQLAVELHDGIGQSLTAAKYCVDNVQQIISQGGSAQEALKSAANVLKSSIKDVRRMQAALRPKMLDEIGVLATLNWFCREFTNIYGAIKLDWQLDITEESIPAMLKPEIYRISQEALNNVAKHSGAESVRLSLRLADREILLSVEDDGAGFDPVRVLGHGEWKGGPGLGLESMRERAELMGGNFKLDTMPGMGTRVQAWWQI